jgi:pRiA4b ORF-3-like protein
MSPVSRGRKGAKSRSRGGDARVLRAVPALPAEPEPCDCPACTGEGVDVESMYADLRGAATDLLTVDDPIDAELLAAMFVNAGALDDTFLPGVIPMLVALGDRSALAMLTAFELVGDSAEAETAARELVAAGVAEPQWAAEAREPVATVELRAYRAGDAASVLICSFDRAGRRHGFIVQIDHTDCFAAGNLMLVPGETLDEVMADLAERPVRDGLTIVEERLAPEDFRWEIQRALDARAVHDEEDGDPEPDDPDNDSADYYPAAALLRARLRALPEPTRPPWAHGDVGPLAGIAEFGRAYDLRRRKRAGELSLPPKPKRKKADGPAPIYRIKVGLRDAKPPIWRRLEVPADITLARLHRVIQVAFGWTDSHIHVFETPYGEYGAADPELGHRSEKPVTLEQVAPAAKERFRYVYDFGDNWLHDIEVEAVLDRDPSASYPRCTAGRRAAPADDSGGIWGHDELVTILADPSHPEHADRLEWLGLESAADFDPAHFDPAEITEALNALR